MKGIFYESYNTSLPRFNPVIRWPALILARRAKRAREQVGVFPVVEAGVGSRK